MAAYIRLAPPAGSGSEQPILLDLIEAALTRAGSADWHTEADGFWCRVTPSGYQFRAQGWKIHVSATPLSAPLVLARCAAVLLGGGCAFKFARDLPGVRKLVDEHYPRGGGGKFITAYPPDDDSFRRLAAELDEATMDLHGPKILSDRPLRQGSLVHYRYGIISSRPVLTNDGVFEPLLVAPDGTSAADRREAWFSPPSWANPPFPGSAAPPACAPSSVRLGGRFVVARAVKHANKGGVYLATDLETQTDVIIKHARRHVGADFDGADARDRLRHEAQMLDAFAPLGISPRKIALFEEQGDVFLAEDLIAGTRLTDWVTARLEQPEPQVLSGAAAVRLAVRLVDLCLAAHSTGLVLRDFNPNNLMVTPGEDFRLIDLECVVHPGALTARRLTLGFAAPEQAQAPSFGPAPGQHADSFSLGATLFFLVTGVVPLFPPDSPARRGLGERVDELMRLMGQGNAALAMLAPLISGLMEESPERRWTVARAREWLGAAGELNLLGSPRSPRSRRPARSPRLPAASLCRPQDFDSLILDGLAYLVLTMTPGSARLWESGDFGATTDPCNVQHGAAGVLAVLTRAGRLGRHDGAAAGTDLPAAIRATADWVCERLETVPRVLPGLYFGRAGTAWALHDAAQFLGDSAMASRAIGIAEMLPVAEWGNPDIAHGLAGAGLTCLHLWQSTGLVSLRQRARRYAEVVLAAARERDGQTLWPIPATFNSSLAGIEHYGFAHGVAGVGAFLLYTAMAENEERLLAAALAAGRTLDKAAQIAGNAAYWPAGAQDAEGPGGMQHWCSGASGAGTFLIRLWHVTADARFRDLADLAAATVHQRRWRAGNSVCHGLAGDGEFLLDMADFTGEEKYAAWAQEIACVIYSRRSYLDGLAVTYGENPEEITADFNTGLSGVLGFLLRLRHRGPRLWMPDDLLPARAASAMAGVP